ncbi:MAG: hypothetical protein IH989_06235 [Planctomycetes bacterium]|nr:hypothetical protein [Planctomycetota bacterium]
MTESATAQAPVAEPEGIKETVESIIVALILAFVFRAFIVEAFVIPTGSMAPTLYGAHGTLVCQDCGFEFAYGLRDLDDHRRTVPVLGKSRATCPNCNHANTNLKFSDDKRNREKGDRILVLKWPLHIGGRLLDPARWDVTVFKDPSDGTTNFIKRLVGLPNEVLMIRDGDVYAVPLDELSVGVRTELERIRHQKFQLRTRLRFGVLDRPSVEVLAELDEKMRVQRKTPAAQKALWYPVYHHDYPPSTLDAGQPYWASGKGQASGWDTSGRTLVFARTQVDEDFIELRGKDIRATCAYNIHSRQTSPPVSDLRIRLVFTPKDDDATLLVRLDKLDRTFWATVQADGLVTLVESRDVPSDASRVLATKQLPPFVAGRSVRISFENVDYRLALRVGGEEVLASSDDPTSPAWYAPDLRAFRANRRQRSTSRPPRLYGWQGAFEIAHLAVDRDEYYYHDPAFRALPMSWAPRMGWASPANPIVLRGHEFFMLGDNTTASKDSRLWDVVGKHFQARGEDFQLGTVPRDQLIGKAFFVYWPSGHRLSWLPIPSLRRFGMIPDVGRMRWIR